ncbi:nucleotidyltransferase domain-containing protein [Brooklawnia sp.]|uniref:nucleotidyltransferase family protein n=1 Tax=Brooklawnia sp. TaxID=2699740 RepID=UPI00311FE7A6
MIDEHRSEIEAVLCANRVAGVRVFGSVARGDADENSDIDLLFARPNGMGLMAMSRLERELSEILGVGVDLVPETALLETVRPSVYADARPL